MLFQTLNDLPISAILSFKVFLVLHTNLSYLNDTVLWIKCVQNIIAHLNSVSYWKKKKKKFEFLWENLLALTQARTSGLSLR